MKISPTHLKILVVSPLVLVFALLGHWDSALALLAGLLVLAWSTRKS